MVTSWLYRLLSKSPSVSRSGRKQPNCGRFVPALESLADRFLPAVTATFSAVDGILRVVGDASDNTIVVSRDVAGTIFVNNGAIPIQGGKATVGNTSQIFLNGDAGNDNLSLNEANGAMPSATISGGDGNDILIGGSGMDFISGGTGNDTISLGGGDDTFQWNPGDGSDVVDGQGGQDTMVFNGSDLAEKFDVSANGSRVRFTRDVGNITMDLNGVEFIDLNALGGADTVTVNDLTATDILNVNLDLNGSTGAGDGQADTVIINGTNGNDLAQISSFDGTISANVSHFPGVNIKGSEETNDTLTVNTLGGNDTVDASLLQGGLIGLIVNGGAGSDTITGSQGDDTFVWNPGDGSDTIDGQGGIDTMVFNGSDLAEKFDVSANGSRVLFTRDVGTITMDLNGVEFIDLNALGGADTVTVNDLTGTDGFRVVNVNLANSAGSGDGQADRVIVNGTNGDDDVRIFAFDNLSSIFVKGLPPGVSITGAEPANDRLTVNGLDGNDALDASQLPANLIGISLNGGAGTNVIQSPLFGDSDGDGDVDSADFLAFRSALGGSSQIFDFDGDGDVDAADFLQFRLRFGSSIP